MMNQWAANIRKFYCFKFFTVFNILNPILIFYMLDRGMTMGEILFLSAIQRLIGIVIEVPTGILSDLKGHKYNLMFGTLSFSISCMVFAFAFNFLGFLLAEVFMALAHSFISGADTAFVYESLEMYNAEDQYERIFGKMRGIQFGMSATVTLVAGFLAQAAWELPFYIAAVFSLIACGIASTFVEPIKDYRPSKGKSVKREREYYRQYYLSLKNAFQISVSRVEIRWFIVFTAILSLGMTTAEDYFQPFMKDVLGLPVMVSGIIYTSLFLISAIFSNFTSEGIKKLGYEKMFYLIPGLVIITVLGMAFFKQYWIIVLFILPYIAAGFIPTLISGYLNRRTNPGQRATILSLRQLVKKLVYAAGCPIIGYFNDYWGMLSALLLTAVILVIAMTLPALYKKAYSLDYEYTGTGTQASVSK